MKQTLASFKAAAVIPLATLSAVAAHAAETEPPIPAAVQVQLPLETRFQAVSEQEKKPAWVTIVNRRETPVHASFEIISQQENGLENRDIKDVKLGPLGEAKILLPKEMFKRYGIYSVKYRVTENGQASEWVPDVIAVYPHNQPAKGGESVFPIGFASGYARVTPRLMGIAASLGFEFHRMEPYWGRVQPQEGVWNWEELDSYMDLVQRHGLRSHLLTTGSANWAAKSHRHAPRGGPWREWITALAQRYKGRVDFWEVWNEPDIGFFDGTITEYNEVQRVAYDAIKAVSPNEVVTSGGFADMNHSQSKPGIMEAAMREYPRTFDWFAYHKHGAFPEFFADLRVQIPTLQQKAGALRMPLVFTETGMDTRSGQRFQAMTLVKKMAYASAIGAKSYVWYNLMDRSGDDEPQKAGFTYGLITNPSNAGDFSTIEHTMKPKESLVAAATAIRALRDRPRRKIWAQDGQNFALLFSKERNHLLTTWNEDARASESLWVVNPKTAKVNQMDIFGNRSAVPIVDGKALISVSDPQYYEFEGTNKTPELVGPLVVVPPRVTSGADNEVNLVMELHNPLRRKISVTPLLLGTSYRVTTPLTTQTIAPGASKKVLIRTQTPSGRFGEIRPLQIGLNYAGLPWSPSFKVPVVFNTIDAAHGQRISVRGMTSVTNKNEHDPHTVSLLWGGPNDLSVDATFNADANAGTLKLKLEVTDNQHHPSPSNQPILNGDAVELGWVTAGHTGRQVEIADVMGGTPRIETWPGTTRNQVVRSVSIAREGSRTTYDLTLDLAAMDVKPAELKEGFRFNFAVHDNDGAGPKSWVSPMPGLGGAKLFAPDNFPRVSLQ